jgi:hypothetical protein
MENSAFKYSYPFDVSKPLVDKIRPVLDIALSILAYFYTAIALI